MSLCHHLVRPFPHRRPGVAWSAVVTILCSCGQVTADNIPPQAFSWTQIELSSEPPQTRIQPVSIYDPGSSSDPQWTQLLPSGALPAPRSDAAAVLDPDSQSLIIFGGDGDYCNSFNDVWKLSLYPTPSWTRLALGDPSPGARTWFGWAFDTDVNRLLNTSGYYRCGGPNYEDTWALQLLELVDQGTTLHVWQDSPAPATPYTNWNTAAHSIQEAVDAASPGDLVLVTNGVYATDGRAVDATMTNRVMINKAITVQSVNGPEATLIVGSPALGGGNGEGAIRCVYVGTNATLSGFTLTNGYTRGRWPKDSGQQNQQEGGGIWSVGGVATNCIIYENTAFLMGPNYYYGSLNYCCTTPLPSAGTGNISLDPQFAVAFHLSENSPCRGAGSDAYATGTDIDGEPWASPPSIGCDEYPPGPPAAPLSVAIRAESTNVPTGFPVDFAALIEGRPTASLWAFDDGLIVTNRPSIRHAWITSGFHTVTLTAYDENNPGGVSAAVTVQTVGPQPHCVSAGSTNPVTNCVFTGNAAQRGGAACGGTLDHCFFGSNDSWEGGGAYGSNLRDCALINNSAGLGGAVNNCTLNDCYIDGNRSDGQGGGAYNSELRNCTLAENWVSGAHAYGGGAFGGTLDHCVLRGNHARATSNERASAGGGAYGSTLSHCTLAGNHVMASGADSSTWGGGAAECILHDCTITGNSASVSGDESYAFGGGVSDSTLHRCRLIENSTHASGQAYGASGGGAESSTLYDCLLNANDAWLGSDEQLSVDGGGASSSILVGCTLVGNLVVAPDDAGAGGGGGADCTLTNCILYYNTAGLVSNYRTCTLDYCCTTPMPTSGLGNLTNEPAFVDLAGGNLRLQPNSPCINAGNNAPVTSAIDLDGNPRTTGGTVDIGAYEFQSPASQLSFAWLQQYRLPTDGSADFTDPDNDRLNNWQEWRCQTDPTNALSVLRLLAAIPTEQDVNVSWQSVAGVSYFLERSTNLSSSPTFLPLATNLIGQAGTTTFTDTNAPPTVPVYYRVGVPE